MMEGSEGAIDVEREEEDDSVTDLLRDRFRLSTISIAEAEAKRNGMEIAEPIISCTADLAFKYTVQYSFVILDVFKLFNLVSAHRNEHLASSLRSFCNDLKAKEPQSERKRKKALRKEDKAATS
ncbi:hypothetical protein CFOL_v3_03733, partial [Cephalotus follicularis]